MNGCTATSRTSGREEPKAMNARPLITGSSDGSVGG